MIMTYEEYRARTRASAIRNLSGFPIEEVEKYLDDSEDEIRKEYERNVKYIKAGDKFSFNDGFGYCLALSF